MRRATLYLVGFLFCALNCCATYGQDQCGLAMQPRYDTYVSWHLDGTTIYTSVEVFGYTYVQFEPGCVLTGVTHWGKVYNSIAGTGGWVQGAPVPPWASIDVTNNQAFTGTSGSTYTFSWEGQVICSKLQTAIFDRSGSISIQDCLVPSSETTQVVGTFETTKTSFNQAISDSAGDSFDGLTLQESDAAPAQDTCFFPTSGVPQVTGVTPGPPWTVAQGDVAGQHNHWGFDGLGWPPAAVNYYRVQAPLHGKPIPCGATVYQAMQISCPSGLATYTPSYGNKLTATIEQTDVINCRYDMNNSACQTINY